MTSCTTGLAGFFFDYTVIWFGSMPGHHHITNTSYLLGWRKILHIALHFTIPKSLILVRDESIAEDMRQLSALC